MWSRGPSNTFILLFQVTVEDNILYATTYFRALEIAKFLKINVQEIKLNLLKIIDLLRKSLLQVYPVYQCSD